MREFLHDNGLAIVSFALFFSFWGAMAVAGFLEYNEERAEHAEARIAFLSYLATGHFWEATFENWESEYLQMGLFVLLTAYFFQKGSAESKTDEEHAQEESEEEQEEHGARPQESEDEAPWPVRAGGLVKKLYENSLGIALLSLFLLSFIFHAIHGAREHNHQQAFLGQPPVTTWEFFLTPSFWFQSFQNWQSEFLAVGSMVVLTIYLRQKGSGESKRVGAPSGETGTG